MHLHSHKNDTGGIHRVWLYSVVFARKTTLAAILLLLLSFLIQPFHQAMANEVEAESVPEEVLPNDVEEQLPDSETEATEEVVEEPAINNVEEEAQEPTTETETNEETASENTPDGSATNDTTNTETEKPSASTTKEIVDENGTEVGDDTATSSDETTNTGNESEETATTTNDGTENDTATSTDDGTATSTEEAGEGNNNDQTGTTTATSTDSGSGVSGGEDTSGTSTETGTDDDNQTDNENNLEPTDNENDTGGSSEDTDNNQNTSNNNSSNDDDLIDNQTIENGVNDLVGNVVNEVVNITRQLVTEENYYQFSKQSCVAVGDGTYHCTTNEKLSFDPDSAIYAEQDADGDMEIYMQTSQGEVKQLSDNDYDDTSPDIDLTSMRAVWQRMIDGRYQIISYDLEKREETQLTFSRTNSMEPKVAKEGIVWQAWDGNDWEILFFDGQFTDQITNNDLQDVTPVVEDGYILWNVLGGEESEARVYSLESGEVMTITGHEGGTVANPRFVLVYDTKFDNGDIVTQGFDPITGLAKPISAQPAELPFDIPEPDPVGEIRALIQNKSVGKDQEVVTVPTADGDGELNLASTTATSSDTLQINNPDLGQVDTPTTTIGTGFELTEYDLVITPVASSTNSVINQDFELGTTSVDVATSTQE